MACLRSCSAFAAAAARTRARLPSAGHVNSRRITASTAERPGSIPGITRGRGRSGLQPGDGRTTPWSVAKGPVLLGSLSGAGRVFAAARGVTNGVEAVTGTPDGDDFEAQLAEAAELLPQPADVDVNGLAVAQVVVAPDLLQQNLAGEDATRTAPQLGEQVPLLGSQLQLGV